MSTGERTPWTAEEIEGKVAETYQASYAYATPILQYLNNQIPPGPYVPSPEVQKQFYEAIKKLWADFLRALADELEERPLPPPPNQPMPEEPPA